MAAILIVEDDLALSDLMRQFLEDEGYRVVAATTLDEAEAAIRTESVDLVISDLVEIEHRGPEGTVEVLRNLAGERPLLLCSGQPNARDLAEGVAQVLPKPFDLDVFLSAVESALSAQPHSSAGGPRSL